MKKLGVIGGLGPMATAYFMRLVTEMTDALSDQEHIEMLVHSKPQIPDRTKFILGESDKSPLPDLLDIAKELSGQGANVIAIPCITAHYFQKELQENTECEVINAIEETAKYLKEKSICKVGIMATKGAVKSRIYQEIFDNYGIESIVPYENDEEKVMHIIYNNIKAGKPLEKEIFDDISDRLFERGAKVIVLGCTELSIIKRDIKLGKGYIDVLDVLARESVKRCGKLKSNYNRLITGMEECDAK